VVIAIAGSFDADATLASTAAISGRSRRPPRLPRHPTQEPSSACERRAVLHNGRAQPDLRRRLARAEDGLGRPEALDVASLVLSGGRSSRLYRKLVYEQQQALGAQGSYLELQEAGLFFAFASVRPTATSRRSSTSSSARSTASRRSSCRRRARQGQRQIEVDLLSGMRRRCELASRIGGEYVNFGRVRPIEERLRAYRAVTAEDVQRVVRTYLTDDQRSVVQVLRAPRTEAAK
jgi:zinc protease